MPLIRLHPAFPHKLRKFTKNDSKRADAVKKALRLFQDDPKHPSLHTEKLKASNVWTIRIDSANRLFFVWSDAGDTAIFFFVGPHDTYRKLRS